MKKFIKLSIRTKHLLVLYALRILTIIKLFKEKIQKTSVQTTVRKKTDQVLTKNIFESYIIGKPLATIYSFKLCLYDDKLIFVFNLEYIKFHNFVPVNLIVCCDDLLLKADTWILLAGLVL